MKPILDKKLYSAIDIIICISLQSSLSPVSSKFISEETGLGLRYVEQILQSLVKDNIIKGIRGINGGYLISKDRRKITLGEVYNAVLKLKNSSKELSFSESSNEVIRGINHDINLKVEGFLNEITLDEIYNKVMANKSAKKSKRKSDFVI